MKLENDAQFEEIMRTYQREIINFHYRFVGNRYAAEDLAQETFVKAYFKFSTLEDGAKLKSWLYQIARRTVIDHYRKNKKYENDVSFDGAILAQFASTERGNVEEEVIDAERSRELQNCIQKLGNEDQKIIKLLYYEGFSYSEIADLIGVNQNTLKSKLHRARKALLVVMQSNKYLRSLLSESHQS